MSRIVNGVSLDELKLSVAEFLYQVKSKEKLSKIQDQLYSISAVISKYDRKWDSFVDCLSLALAPKTKRYFQMIVSVIFDNMEKYTGSEKKQVESVLSAILEIAKSGMWDEIKKVSEGTAQAPKSQRSSFSSFGGGYSFMTADRLSQRSPSFSKDNSSAAVAGAPASTSGGRCPCCGEEICADDKFCSGCGSPVSVDGSGKVNVNQVQFSAVVPKQFVKGEYSMIDISVYEEKYRNVVDTIISNADGEVREVLASAQDVAENTKIRIELSSPDIDVSDCVETQTWKGRYLTYSFPVEIPATYAKKQVLFVATVFFNGMIATKLKFVANCTTAKDQKLQLTREDVLTAFISYASQDRSRVATIIQGMKKARPDMDIFFDVENLHSGEDWERTLRREIENRDILFLCWSNFAKESKWVETEWRYALAQKGLDAIEPIPLVSPAECPPPEELKSKHFNDKVLIYAGM